MKHQCIFRKHKTVSMQPMSDNSGILGCSNLINSQLCQSQITLLNNQICFLWACDVRPLWALNVLFSRILVSNCVLITLRFGLGMQPFITNLLGFFTFGIVTAVLKQQDICLQVWKRNSKVYSVQEAITLKSEIMTRGFYKWKLSSDMP